MENLQITSMQKLLLQDVVKTELEKAKVFESAEDFPNCFRMVPELEDLLNKLKEVS